MVRSYLQRPPTYLLITLTIWLFWMQLYWQLVDDLQLTAWLPYLQIFLRSAVNTIAAVYSYRCAAKSVRFRAVFTFFMISMMALTVAGLIYDYVNLIQFNYLFTTFERYAYRSLMIIHLATHLSAWLHLLFTNNHQLHAKSNLYLPYFITFSIVAMALLMSQQWYSLVLGSDEVASIMSFKFIAKIIQNIINIYCIIVIGLFLSRATRSWSKYLVWGSLITNTPNLFVYHYPVQSYLRLFTTTDMLIVLGTMLMIAGMKDYLDSPEKNKGVGEINSLSSQTTAWISSVMYFTLLIIILSAAAIGGRYIKDIFTLDTIITSVVVCALSTSILSMLLSQFVSSQFSKITRLIERFNTENADTILIATATDIAELRELEEFIEDSYHIKQNADEKSQALTQHALQVAHDLRAPLIILNKLCNKNRGNIDSNEYHSIKKSVEAIRDISERILNYHRETARAHHGTILLVGPMLKEAVERFKLICFGKEIEIDCTSSVPMAAIYFDKTDITRIINNVLSNAVEAIDSRGRISIQVSKRNALVEISISDTGQGIAKDMLPLVYRKDVTTKASGTGLGLSITKQLMISNDGDISIESTEGKGTTVRLQFPQAVLPNIYHMVLPSLVDQSVVLVSDDDDIIEYFQKNTAPMQNRNVTYISSLDTRNIDALVSGMDWIFLDYKAYDVMFSQLDNKALEVYGAKLFLISEEILSHGVTREMIKLGARCLIKSMLPYVTLQSKNNPIILYDDSPELGYLWRLAGRRIGIDVLSVTSHDKFKELIGDLPKDTPIYIDVDLGDKLSGVDVSRDVAMQGYTNIYLCTAYDTDEFLALDWIVGVVDKTPPF